MAVNFRRINVQVEIYSKANCGFCDKAIRLAEANKLDFTVKKLDVDFNREQLLEQFPNAKSFPIVLINGVVIGGFTEFNTYLQVG
jgi:thioredoxin reductase (NADPH)